MARRYDIQGADEITFLDITASNVSVLSCRMCFESSVSVLSLTVGGGVRSVEDVRLLLKAGADKVGINTAAVANPELVKQAVTRFGSQCIVVAIDARKSPLERDKWEVYTHGGRNASGLDAVSWASQMADYGAGEI